MFHRRRAASSPASRTPPSAAASLAASQAFIKNRDSNASLSSAAAAAALRTIVPTPTPVGNIVTKRMKRKGSVSSAGSGSQNAPGLQRQSSTGSMAERSFRAPSPGPSPVPARDNDTPPVPRIPQAIREESATHRRASSLESPLRGDSSAGRGRGRGGSVDRGHAQRTTGLTQVPEVVPESPRSSINFSRPISPQAASPARVVASERQSGYFTGPVINNQEFRGGVTTKKKATGLSQYEATGLQQSIHNVANSPVASKKNKMGIGVEGARLANGGMGVKPTGSALPPSQSGVNRSTPGRTPPSSIDPKSPLAIYDPSTRTFIPKQVAMAKFRELNEEEIDDAQNYPVPHQRAEFREVTVDDISDAQGYLPQKTAPASRQRASHTAPIAQAVSHTRSHPLPRSIEQEHQPTPPREQSPPPRIVHADTKAYIPDSVPQKLPTPPPEPHIGEPAVLPRRSSEDFGEADQIAEVEDHFVDSPPLTRPESPSSPQLARNQESPFPRLATSEPEPPKPSPSKRKGSLRGERTQSLSPPRAAHFAPVAVEFDYEMRHNPPARSVSPAKSAMKTASSTSTRNSSPIAKMSKPPYKVPPSEASDTMSEDGTKKKKRVSFDEEAVIAGTSAYTESTPSTGLATSKWSSQSAISAEEDDEVLTPRPALPSFGSIRGRHRRPDDDDAMKEERTETLPPNDPSLSLEPSSDHAIGGIIAHDFASKGPPLSSNEKSQSHLEPIPPEVTSVEGSGYVSDSDQSDMGFQAAPAPKVPDYTESALPELEPKTLTKSVDSAKPGGHDVPAIAILPASPSPTKSSEDVFGKSLALPGGWSADEATNSTDQAQRENGNKLSTDHTQITNSEVSSAESSDDDNSIYADAYEEFPDDESSGEGFASIDAVVENFLMNSTSNHAAKTQAVSNPVNPPPILDTRTLPSFPREEKSPISPPIIQPEHGLGDLKDLQVQLRREVAAERSAPTAASPATSVPSQKDANTESRNHITELGTIQERTSPVRPAQAPPASAKPLKSALKKSTSPTRETQSLPQMKKTMRGAQDSPRVASPEPQSLPQMKKTMRGAQDSPRVVSPEPRLRKSMRSDESGPPAKAGSGLSASRHSVPSAETRPSKGALQKKQISTAGAATNIATQRGSRPVTTKPSIPAPAYDSDSDASTSSFVRQRPRASRKTGGRYTMRSSMRGAAPEAPSMRPTPTMRPVASPTGSPPPSLRKTMRPSSPPAGPPSPGFRSSRFSIRSLSPAGRLSKRESLVDSPPLPPIHTQAAKKKSSKLPGFGKSSKSKPSALQTSKPKFRSRFADSSDEDDDRPPRFQSRFADSDSDEDFTLPSGLTPVRGIPRKAGEEDAESTDLEDEASDAEAAPVKDKDVEKSLTNGVNGTTSKHATFAPTSLLKSKHAPETPTFEPVKKSKSKRGFFGLGKKKVNPVTPEPEPETKPAQPVSSDIPLPPNLTNRPLTPIGEDATETPTDSPRPPKLQRRLTPQWGRTASDSWPLSQDNEAGTEPARPQTADGPPSRRLSFRPGLSKRHSSAASESAVKEKDEEVVMGRHGKKKRFPMLRKAFGLND